MGFSKGLFTPFPFLSEKNLHMEPQLEEKRQEMLYKVSVAQYTPAHTTTRLSLYCSVTDVVLC